MARVACRGEEDVAVPGVPRVKAASKGPPTAVEEGSTSADTHVSEAPPAPAEKADEEGGKRGSEGIGHRHVPQPGAAAEDKDGHGRTRGVLCRETAMRGNVGRRGARAGERGEPRRAARTSPAP